MNMEISMIWMFFLACITKKVDTAEMAELNIALCEQALEGFNEYRREIFDKVEYSG